MTRVLRLTTFARPSSLLAAQHRGFLEEEGLALEVEDAEGSRPQMDGLLAGRWDLAHTNADNVMKYRAFCSEDLAIFLVLDRGIAQKLVVSPDVVAGSDLRGRPVGVDAPDSGYAFVLYDLLRRHGLEQGDYEVAALGATVYRLQGLQRGEIAAALLSHHHEATAIEQGFRLLADTRDHFGRHPGVTAATTRSWAQRNQDALCGYTTAILRAAQWATDPDNREEVVRVIAEGRRVSEERARRLLHIETASRTGVVRSVDEAAACLAETAALREQYTGTLPTGYFDPTTMQQVLMALGRGAR